jgi:acyl-coenzyme A thioesterase PaaI-like protein
MSTLEERAAAFRQSIGLNLKGRTVSPVADLFDGTLLALADNLQSLSIEFVARREFCNPRQTIQGGMAMAALDEALGMLVNFLHQKNMTTASFNADFLSPVLEGEKFIVNGTPNSSSVCLSLYISALCACILSLKSFSKDHSCWACSVSR